MDAHREMLATLTGADIEPVHCKTERDSWTCPNMKEVENDTSLTHEHYKCDLCGRRVSLDYDEIR
jgi:hypothetical protein